jgi:hypothetical protein
MVTNFEAWGSRSDLPYITNGPSCKLHIGKLKGEEVKGCRGPHSAHAPKVEYLCSVKVLLIWITVWR